MKIGRALRALELPSFVPSKGPSDRPECGAFESFPKPKDPKNCTCASACFFIHVGSVSRNGKFLAVHRPYFEKGKFGELSESEAKKAFETLQESARDYMLEMGVAKHIQENVLGTSSERALILDEKTVETYFLGLLPYRHEWIRNKCSRLSSEETVRSEGYSRRLRKARSSTDADLSKDEWADLGILQKKQSEELHCAVVIDKQSRIEAFQKYFGVSPTDFANHNFSKWSRAPKYLGKNFDELLSEERFEEKKFAKTALLRRPATVSAPNIMLSDAPWKPRVVTYVSLYSRPNPSPEFIQHLVKSLEDVWGKHSGGNGTSEWIWVKEGFTATLEQTVAGEGPYLSLTIN